jgi:hypothetical protein
MSEYDGDCDPERLPDDVPFAQVPGTDWLVRSVDGTTFTSTAMTIEGTFQPLVGNFDHNGTTDILWYRPGTHMDDLWRAVGGGQGTISFTSSELTVNGYYHPSTTTAPTARPRSMSTATTPR